MEFWIICIQCFVLGADNIRMIICTAHHIGRLNFKIAFNKCINDKKNGAIVLVMQRLHEDDLTAHLLAKDEGWVHLNLPAIAMQDEIWNLPYGQTYLRKKGEALHEARESREQLVGILKAIGGHPFSYQYLQGAYKPRFGDTGHGCIWLRPDT